MGMYFQYLPTLSQDVPAQSEEEGREEEGRERGRGGREGQEGRKRGEGSALSIFIRTYSITINSVACSNSSTCRSQRGDGGFDLTRNF